MQHHRVAPDEPDGHSAVVAPNTKLSGVVQRARYRCFHVGSRAVKTLRGRSFSDLVSLYAVYIATYVVPLVTVPYLSRTLGPQGWGLVAFFQSFALTMALVIEYGFGYSATRELAVSRDTPSARAAIFSDVMAAKAIIVVATCPVALLLLRNVGNLHNNTGLFAAACVLALAQGFNLAWYYQGMDRITEQAKMDLCTRAIGAVAIFILVKTPEHGFRALLVNAGSAAGGLVWGLSKLRTGHAIPRPTLSGGVAALKAGGAVFLHRAALSLYTLGNGFILGLLAAPIYVGYYAGAERIARGMQGFLIPLSQVIYSRTNYAFSKSKTDALRIARRGLFLMVTAGAMIGLILAITAKTLVTLALGPQYGPAILALQIFAILPPIAALATSLGVHWMIPLRFDRSYALITVVSGFMNLILASVLATRYHQNGMCLSVIFSEVAAALSCFLYLTCKGYSPFRVNSADV